MSYQESIQYLYDLRKHGTKFGLDNIRRLAEGLGNPHTAFRSVHVGGTNGKGSTAAIVASLLQSAGYAVGLFTSPHLVSFTERIRINGKEIGEHDVVSLAEEVREMALQIHDFSPTFFEAVTAMAFLHFSRQRVDFAVMEVGMGGRLDATNIVSPDVSVITGISCDHREFLGSALSSIAGEKAGIIKTGIPVVCAHQAPEALQVIVTRAQENHAGLHLYGKDFSSRLLREDFNGIQFDFRDSDGLIEDIHLPLAGTHQMENASLAIKALRLISGFLNRRIIKEGVRSTTWPGRLEMIHDDPPVLIDGAHNPAAAAVLAQALSNIFLRTFGGIILILGIMSDKDIPGILSPLLPLARQVILTRPSFDRAASPETLARTAELLGYSGLRTAHTMQEALDMGMKEARALLPESPLLVVTGSLYTIGEAKQILGNRGVLTTLRE